MDFSAIFFTPWEPCLKSFVEMLLQVRASGDRCKCKIKVHFYAKYCSTNMEYPSSCAKVFMLHKMMHPMTALINLL